ncbi:hypoxia-inducible factor 1-alpha isoform X2 [Bacillus rossius redtenbacheri]|uniref:hypoxia-inducible factor 1-alpha isoform X2 n=1 Tax=Bacillus rossius redtenbacheri TaxID=93214 RepID=UPI002FDCA35C
MDTKTKPVKEKRRNSEKRKEKSRDAARCRRSRETEIFMDLARALPLPPSSLGQLDKASVMRLAISYLKVRSLLHPVPDEKRPKEKAAVRIIPKFKCGGDQLFLRALEGFLLVVSAEGDMVFLSENIHEYLGITQFDLMGHSIYEFSHPCDHDEIKDILSIKAPIPHILSRSFFLRMKCTLTSKGRNVNLKSASYKVIHCTGHLLAAPQVKEESKSECKDEGDANNNNKKDSGSGGGCGGYPQHCLVAIGEPIPHPSNIEIPLDKQTFLSKHSLDMKFTYADDKIGDFLGYCPEDLVGKSMYDYHHAMDNVTVEKGFKCLFSKGQCETGCYRFLAKNGGYVWVLTQATLIYGSKGHKPNSVVCVNFVISGLEHQGEVFSSSQLAGAAPAAARVFRPAPPLSVTAEVFSARDAPPRPPRPQAVTSEVFAPCPLPQAATAKIFAPRTEDMNKGFLTFSDDEPGLTMLKDEPDDLTHLAPTAGDACIPLEATEFMSEMFDQIMFSDNYCPLLADDQDLASLSDSQSSSVSKGSNDPFFSYRDDTSSSEPSPSGDFGSYLHSPSHSKSPGDSSVPSLCSPGNATEDTNIPAFTSFNMDASSDCEEDLCTRAPYIPMGFDEDFPLLVSPELMWGALPESSGGKRSSGLGEDDPAFPAKPNLNSSLAQLLQKDSPVPCASHGHTAAKCNDHGGGLVNPAEVLGQIFTKKRASTAGAARERLPERPAVGKGAAPPPDLAKIPPGTGPPDRSAKRPAARQDGGPAKRGRTKPRGGATWPPSPAQRQSNSVLMNLLVSGCDVKNIEDVVRSLKAPPDRAEADAEERKASIRKNSFSLLEPDPAMIPSLADLSQQDYEVNAPLSSSSSLLKGRDLLLALDASSCGMELAQ